jgi:hypothetical protein
MQYYKSASINFKLFIINIIRIKNCKNQYTDNTTYINY